MDVPSKFVCEPCGKTFSAEKYLKRHKTMIHLKPKLRMNDCVGCGKVFSCYNSLWRHKRVVCKIPMQSNMSTVESSEPAQSQALYSSPPPPPTFENDEEKKHNPFDVAFADITREMKKSKNPDDVQQPKKRVRRSTSKKQLNGVTNVKIDGGADSHTKKMDKVPELSNDMNGKDNNSPPKKRSKSIVDLMDMIDMCDEVGNSQPKMQPKRLYVKSISSDTPSTAMCSRNKSSEMPQCERTPKHVGHCHSYPGNLCIKHHHHQCKCVVCAQGILSLAYARCMCTCGGL